MDVSRVGTHQASRRAPEIPAGRALVPRARTAEVVPVAPVNEAASLRTSPRPAAAFLAQLLAGREHLPQARRLRRADPAEAVAAYGAAAGLGPGRGPSVDRRL